MSDQIVKDFDKILSSRAHSLDLPPAAKVYSKSDLLSLLETLEVDETSLSRPLIKRAALIAVLGSTLDLLLVGDPTQVLGKNIFTALGAPEQHLHNSPKVPFDKTLGAEFGATGNHRWNSLSHHPTLSGLISGVKDLFNSTSTHIVDAEVVIVESTNKTLEEAMEKSPLSDPNAWAIMKLLWATGHVISHWWSDVNTSIGLPGPLSTLAKCVEGGDFEYKGMNLNLADVSYELYRDGLDLRRFIADGMIPLSMQLSLRWCAFCDATARGAKRRDAIREAVSLSEANQKVLLIAYALCASSNFTKVWLTSNPLLINVNQWTALLRQALKQLINSANRQNCESVATEENLNKSVRLLKQLQTLRSAEDELTQRIDHSLGSHLKNG